jgi:hypothetical protein
MEFDLHGFLATALYIRKQYRYDDDDIYLTAIG